jgi:hypothetical protein
MKFGKTLNRGFYYGNRKAIPPSAQCFSMPLKPSFSAAKTRLGIKTFHGRLMPIRFVLIPSPVPLVDSNFEQACCEREQIQVSKFVFPDGMEASVAGGAATAEGHVGDLDKKRKESAKREEGGSEIGSLVGSSIR